MSCSLEAIPEEVSHIDGLERLFLNGNFLRSLPPEVGALPALEQLCVDANLLRTLPALLSPKLNLIADIRHLSLGLEVYPVMPAWSNNQGQGFSSCSATGDPCRAPGPSIRMTSLS
ncbi:unnamed protein product [Prorocentrum cordatum]|nr:unnamed protein product [Polarella glacialis]